MFKKTLVALSLALLAVSAAAPASACSVRIDGDNDSATCVENHYTINNQYPSSRQASSYEEDDVPVRSYVVMAPRPYFVPRPPMMTFFFGGMPRFGGRPFFFGRR